MPPPAMKAIPTQIAMKNIVMWVTLNRASNKRFMIAI